MQPSFAARATVTRGSSTSRGAKFPRITPLILRPSTPSNLIRQRRWPRDTTRQPRQGPPLFLYQNGKRSELLTAKTRATFHPTRDEAKQKGTLLILNNKKVQTRATRPNLLYLTCQDKGSSPLFRATKREKELRALLNDVLIRCPTRAVSNDRTQRRSGRGKGGRRFPKDKARTCRGEGCMWANDANQMGASLGLL